MPDTYTPPTGNTPQGMDLASLNSALSAITGQVPQSGSVPNAAALGQQAQAGATAAQAAFPAFQNNQATGLMGASGVPQAASAYNMDVNTFMKMMQADHGFAGQFFNPNAQNAPDAINNAQVVGAAPQLTMGNVNQPFQGTPDLGQATNIGNVSAGALTGNASNIMDLIGNNLGKMNSQLNINTGEYSSQVNALQNLANYLSNIATQQEQVREFNVGAGLQGNPLSTDGTSIADDSSMTYDQKLQKLQEAIDNAPNTTAQKQYQTIRDSYVKEHQLPQADETAYTGSLNTLNDIQNVESALTDPTTSTRWKKIMGNPITGNAAKLAIQSGQFEILKTLGFTDQDVAVITSMNNVNVTRDRSMLGGRVTGYLLGALGAGNMDLNKSVQQNLATLKVAKEHIYNNMNEYAKNKGMTINDLPGIGSYLDYLNQSTGTPSRGAGSNNNDPMGLGL